MNNLQLNKKVSIIIPTYNSIKTIEYCLKSVINQSYSNIEVIIIDGHSSDGTIEWLEHNVPNECIFIKTKKGVSLQRNKGIEVANGDYLTFIDSDDCIDKNYILNLVLNIGNCDIAIPTLKSFEYVEDIPNNVKKIHYTNINNHDFFYGGHSSCLISPFKLYKRHIIDNIRFKEDVHYAEDLLFNYEIFKNKHPLYSLISNSIYYYRTLPDINPASKRLYKCTLSFFKYLIAIYKNEKNTYLLNIIYENYISFIKEFIYHKHYTPIEFFKVKIFLLFNYKKIIKKLVILFPRLYFCKQRLKN